MWPFTKTEEPPVRIQIAVLQREIDKLKKKKTRKGTSPADIAAINKKIDELKGRIELLKRKK
jgi:hypothetical protein